MNIVAHHLFLSCVNCVFTDCYTFYYLDSLKLITIALNIANYSDHSLRLLQISPEYSGSVLTLRAPGMMSISIDLAQLRGKGFRVAVWGQAVPARDCGEEVARWLSRFLLQEDAGFRLVYYPLDRPAREVRKRNENFFPLTSTTDTVSTFFAMIRCTRFNNYNLFVQKID